MAEINYILARDFLSLFTPFSSASTNSAEWARKQGTCSQARSTPFTTLTAAPGSWPTSNSMLWRTTSAVGQFQLQRDSQQGDQQECLPSLSSLSHALALPCVAREGVSSWLGSLPGRQEVPVHLPEQVCQLILSNRHLSQRGQAEQIRWTAWSRV